MYLEHESKTIKYIYLNKCLYNELIEVTMIIIKNNALLIHTTQSICPFSDLYQKIRATKLSIVAQELK